MKIRIGPAGIGGFTEAPKFLEYYNKEKINAAEIPFTYKVWINNSQAEEIGKIADKFDIQLSVHAPYWINLNSKERDKIEQSKIRILKSAERVHYLGGGLVVFHPGYYGGKSKDETFSVIAEEIKDMMKVIREKKWNVRLAPETTGKINVFGDLTEILELVKQTNCSFTIDFAHILARSKGKIDYDDVYNKLKNLDNIHCHFSGIEWGEKGERNHKMSELKEIRELVSEILKRKKSVTIIDESPDPIKGILRIRDEFIKQGYKF